MAISPTVYRARLVEVNCRLNKTISDLYDFAFALSDQEELAEIQRSFTVPGALPSQLEFLKQIKDEKIPALVEMIKVLSCAQTAFELINGLGTEEQSPEEEIILKVKGKTDGEKEEWEMPQSVGANCSDFMKQITCDLYYLFNEVLNLVGQYNSTVAYDTFQSWLESTNLMVHSNDLNVGFLIKALNRVFSALRGNEFKIKGQLC